MLLVQNTLAFIHIPKTSGTSLTKLLRKYASTTEETYDDNDGWQGTYHFNEGFCNGQHTSIDELTQDELLLLKDIPIITIVRNPYSWMVSFYENFHHNKTFPSFEEFLRHVSRHHDLKWGKKLLQMDYIQNIHNLKVRTYKFEETPHVNICQDFGIEYAPVHELNSERGTKLNEYYTDELIQIVNHVFARDFRCLRYGMVTRTYELLQN